MRSTGHDQRGFTLTELMITVAIAAILGAIAYPSYLSHMRKSHRADAQSLLMTAADRQQQFLLDTRAYGSDLAALHVSMPASVTRFYTVTMTVGASTVPAFTATAAPLGDQALDKCGTLTLTNTGAKSPTGCW